MTLQKKATLVSSLTASVLVIMKLIVGVTSGSIAVLASAIDSLLDLIVSAFNYFAIHKSELPPDKRFNYGRGKIEAIAAVIEGTIITLSGGFILYSAIKKIYDGEHISELGNSMVVMIISMIATFALVTFLNYVAKKTDSLVIKSDALHYKTDLYSNGAVLVSLGLIYLTDFGIIDGVVGVGISLYIIYSAYELIKEGTLILLDASLEDEVVEQIVKAIDSQPLVTSFHDLKTRRSAHTNYVEVHLVFNRTISLLDAHDATEEIEEKIKRIDEADIWNINIHLDPYDDSLSHAKKSYAIDNK